jgi:hypothetical protein
MLAMLAGFLAMPTMQDTWLVFCLCWLAGWLAILAL